ncbi:glycoside hydrolase family 2 TIM barrel-domain containing protein [Lentisphaerota bacterium WC36G]|nr:DUF4982 domain-containing protein [Lentisphaerae bacterium WC36]
MRIILLMVVFLCNFFILPILEGNSNNKENCRIKKNFDFDWHFIQKDVKNAHLFDFDHRDWNSLDLPHDWSIEGTYDKKNPAGIHGAFLPAGIGWYRKNFDLKLQKSKKLFINFDGVYMNAKTWINGHYLGIQHYGYIGFSYDLTPYLRDGKNVISVRVDNSNVPSSRWYTGSGIYRHVWLTETNTTYIPKYGVSVQTALIENDVAKLNISTEIKTEEKSLNLYLKAVVKDSKGNICQSYTSKKFNSEIKTVAYQLDIKKPQLWSPHSPELYTLETVIMQGKNVFDSIKTKFGIRTVKLIPNKGFALNGKIIKLKGLSNHHDGGGAVGAAVPDDILWYRLKLLKDMGCNAVRTAHNPFSPEFYEMCDRLGLMVMDECFDGWWKTKAKFDYGLYFKDNWKKDLEKFIKRDRNHPSVVIWSIGNEVHGFTNKQQKTLVDFVKAIDATRPVTQGDGYDYKNVDIAGFNGRGEYRGVLENYHKKNPDQLIIGTEITHTLQTRGIYRSKTWYRLRDNPAPWEVDRQNTFGSFKKRIFLIPDFTKEEVFKGINKKYQSGYDNSIVRIGVRDDWNRVEKYPWYIGNFRWTGFDYLGESFGWPARTANFGIIDLAGFPKDHYYLYQSLWSNKPMVHMLPHWTHPNKDGVKIPVVVYTNCEKAELFLNNQSLGEKKMTEKRQLVWLVPYVPGTIKIVAKNGNEICATKAYSTANNAAKIETNLDKYTLNANRKDIARIEVKLVDEKGLFNPNDDKLIKFEIAGPAKLVGVENGDILDLSSNKIPERKTFKGKCLLVIKSTDKKGLIKITLKAEGLKSKILEIKSK